MRAASPPAAAFLEACRALADRLIHRHERREPDEPATDQGLGNRTRAGLREKGRARTEAVALTRENGWFCAQAKLPLDGADAIYAEIPPPNACAERDRKRGNCARRKSSSVQATQCPGRRPSVDPDGVRAAAQAAAAAAARA